MLVCVLSTYLDVRGIAKCDDSPPVGIGESHMHPVSRCGIVLGVRGVHRVIGVGLRFCH